MKRQHEPIKEITGTRAERVLVLSHGAAEVTAGVMPTVLGILDANGVEVLATAEEVAKLTAAIAALREERRRETENSLAALREAYAASDHSMSE